MRARVTAALLGCGLRPAPLLPLSPSSGNRPQHRGPRSLFGKIQTSLGALSFFLTQAFSSSPRVCTGEEVAARDPSFSLRWPRTCPRRKKGLALPSPAARPPPAHAQRLLTGPLAPDHTLVCVLLKCSLFASQLFFFHKVRGACIWVFVSSKDLQRLRVWHVTGMSQRPERHSHSVLNSCCSESIRLYVLF